jgi:hypothetical protein
MESWNCGIVNLCIVRAVCLSHLLPIWLLSGTRIVCPILWVLPWFDAVSAHVFLRQKRPSSSDIVTRGE